MHLESEELNKYGEPKYVKDLDLKCNFQDTAKTVLTAEKKAGADYRHGSILRRYCAGYSGAERGDSYCIRYGAAYSAGHESPQF